MTHRFLLDGQPLVYGAESKICKTTIEEPFIKAGKILGWIDHCPGIGLNKKIIEFVVRRKATLIVHVASAGNDYWISWDKLQDFIKNNNTEYMAGGKKLVDVISWKAFTRKPLVMAC